MHFQLSQVCELASVRYFYADYVVCRLRCMLTMSDTDYIVAFGIIQNDAGSNLLCSRYCTRVQPQMEHVAGSVVAKLYCQYAMWLSCMRV